MRRMWASLPMVVEGLGVVAVAAVLVHVAFRAVLCLR